MCQVYGTTLLAWLYWSRYISSLLLSCWSCVSWLLKRSPSEEPKAGGSAPLRRLYQFARPYLWRFAAVMLLVVLSSYGKTNRSLKVYSGRLVFLCWKRCCVYNQL